MKTLKIGLLALPLLMTSLSTAAVQFKDPTNLDSVPKVLSGWGFYTSMNTKQLDTAVKHFEVNAALWSDAAHKDRWIVLPPGTHITYNDTTDAFDYPERTIFVKLFRHDTVVGDTNSRIYWETRVLMKKTGSQVWHGFSYKWNAAGTEATLVSVENGLDTVVHLAGYPRYRKWLYPSQSACYDCHRPREGKRGVLGFFPAQLKRPSAANPSVNQIKHLENIGVFQSGTTTGANLGARWRGIAEGIPAGLQGEARFRVIDTMARAYIAANCSGCHGTRGISDGAIGHAGELNYDFHTLKPVIEFGAPGNTSSLGLNTPDADLGAPGLPTGRARMMRSIAEWGLPTGDGALFDMRRPWMAPGSTEERAPSLISSGYPSFSTAIFRQLARRSPKYDSVSLRQRFAEEGDTKGWSAWIFKAPWGSKAWSDTLRARNVTLLEVASAAGLGGISGFGFDSEAMPPLSTYIPDTAALKVLAEWAKTYRTLVKIADQDSIYPTRLNNTVARRPAAMPAIRNGLLIAPEGWTGKATMISLTGRSYALSSVGRGRYALPSGAPSGIYVFRIGDKTFRTSLVR